MNKKYYFVILFLILTPISVFAYNLDTSVNNEIEKKYDSNKLNQDMQIKQISTQSKKQTLSNKSVPKSTPVFDNSIPQVSKNTQIQSLKTSVGKAGILIPAGTKFIAKSSSGVSSRSGINSSVNFVSINTMYGSNITIPAGTTFTGVISASHKGQITGNGGLIKIRITGMKYKGKNIRVEGKITKANSKKIFFNNIKGTRQYLQGVDNKITQGINFYNKSRRLSYRMSSNPVGTILSPLPTITGWIGSAVCTLASPVTGLIQKGKDISLPSGTFYEIKLTEDAYIN